MSTISDTLHTATMMRMYIDITKELGPSEQLLRFVNFDKNIGQEIGLESYEEMSLQTRHEILLSKLNPDLLESMACENLAEKIDKITTRVGIGSAVASFITGIIADKSNHIGWTIGSLSALAITAGSIVVNSVNYLKNAVVPYRIFKRQEAVSEKALAETARIVNSLPTSFEPGVWKKYYEKDFKKGGRVRNLDQDLWEDIWVIQESWKEFGDEAGWDPDKFAEAVKWTISFAKRLEPVRKTWVSKLEKMESWIRDNKNLKDPETKETIKNINNVLWNIDWILDYAEASLKEVEKILTKISKSFKEVKK